MSELGSQRNSLILYQILLEDIHEVKNNDTDEAVQ